MSLRLHATALLACIALSAAVPALAAEAEQLSVTVSVAGLDLATDAGQAALARRVARAASAVCGPVDSRDLAALARYHACRDDAIAGAAPRVDALIAAAGGGRHYAMNQGGSETVR